MRAIRLGNKIIKTLVRDAFFYPTRLIVDTSGIIARCGVLLILYWYVFRLNGGTINNTTFFVAAWSIFFYFAFSVFRLRDISRLIMQDVQTGNVELLFSKPISYLAYRMWWQIGLGLYSFLIISFLGSIVLFLLIGLPATMTIGIFLPTLFLAIIFGVVLSLLLYSLVGILAFWIEDINPVFWIVDKTVMILGGSYLPVALFPKFMYKIALFSPFGASQFVTHSVYTTWQTEWYMRIGTQIFWIIIIAAIVLVLFNQARKKVSVNGG